MATRGMFMAGPYCALDRPGTELKAWVRRALQVHQNNVDKCSHWLVTV